MHFILHNSLLIVPNLCPKCFNPFNGIYHITLCNDSIPIKD